MITPQFQHDCEACKFRGRFNGMDVYKCDSGKATGETIILRRSDEGGDYESMDVYYVFMCKDGYPLKTAAMLCAIFSELFEITT